MADRLLTDLIDSFNSQSPQENVNKAITKISNTMDSLHKNAQMCEDKINWKFDTIIHNLDAKRKELLTKLQHIKDLKHNKLLHQQNALNQMSSSLQTLPNNNSIHLSTNADINISIDIDPINDAISIFASIKDGYIPRPPTIDLKTKNYFKAVILITNNEDEKDTISHRVIYHQPGHTPITKVINMQNNYNKCIEHEINGLSQATRYQVNVSTQTSNGSSKYSNEICFKTSRTPVWLNYNEEKEEHKLDLEYFTEKIADLTLNESVPEPTEDIRQLITRLQKLNLPLKDEQFFMIGKIIKNVQYRYSKTPELFASWNSKLLHELFSTYDTLRAKYKSVSTGREFRKIGTSMYIDKYPQQPNKHLNVEYEQRLVSIFGMPYRNRLWLQWNENEWSVNCKMLCSLSNWYSNDKNNFEFVFDKCIDRGFAVNARNGWVVTMSLNNMYVFEPSGSCFRLRATFKFSDESGCPVMSEMNNEKGRVRFVNNDIFVWDYVFATIYKFVLKSVDDECVIELVDTMRNNYFRDSQNVDIVVTDKLLILLFDRWLGVYKLHPKLEWYHAIGFAKRSVVAHSFEMSYFDDSEDRDPLCEKAYFGDNSIEMKVSPPLAVFLRETNINYAIINASNQIIGIHPTNPTFHFVHIASDIQTRFCVSKRYGVFYINDDGKCIYQSSHLQSQSVHSVVHVKDGILYADDDMIVSMKPLETVKRICNVVYDEMYGISGRLLITVQTIKKEYFVQQLINYEELIHFADESNKVDYYSVPGIVIVYVYNILYGDDVIQSLLQSHAVNQSRLDD